MMLRNKFALWFAAVAPLLASMPAAHALDLAVVGALTLPNQSVDPEPVVELDSKLGVGFGALATVGLAPTVGLQAGALYLPNKRAAEVLGVESTVSYQALNIPVAVRVSPIDLFSLGIGGYWATRVTDITTETGGVSVDTDPSSSSDLGLLGSVAVKFPVAPLIGIVADARYLFGLKDLDDSDSTSAKTRDLQFLVGLNIGL